MSWLEIEPVRRLLTAFSRLDRGRLPCHLIGVHSGQEIELNREGRSGDAKVQAAIDFARNIVEGRGFVSDDVFEAARVHLSEEEVLEVITITSFNLFTNYMNHALETKIDFPVVELVESAAV